MALTRRDVAAVAADDRSCGSAHVALRTRSIRRFARLADPPAFWLRGAPAGRRAGRNRDGDRGSREARPDGAVDGAAARAGGRRADRQRARAGIDAAAHRGALAAASRRSLTWDTAGSDYPAEHAGLEAAIVAGGGAVARERLPGERVNRWSLIRRDRLQAAHARSVVLVQSEIDGGAMHTCALPSGSGRERAALIPRPGAAFAGNAEAIRSGQLCWRGNSDESGGTENGRVQSGLTRSTSSEPRR